MGYQGKVGAGITAENAAQTGQKTLWERGSKDQMDLVLFILKFHRTTL